MILVAHPPTKTVEVPGPQCPVARHITTRGAPKRSLNALQVETASLLCDFNFKQPTQLSSLMNVILMAFIMLLMVGYSVLLSKSVFAIVMKPLEELLMKACTLILCGCGVCFGRPRQYWCSIGGLRP